MRIEKRLKSLGLELPDEVKLPPGVQVPFCMDPSLPRSRVPVRPWPLNTDGSPAGPFGRVGAEVTAEQAHTAAKLATLALLSSLKFALGDLDRVVAWLTISGMVNVAPGFAATTNVINGCSEVLLEVFGPVVGQHARTAIGMAALPLNLPVILAAEVAVRPQQRRGRASRWPRALPESVRFQASPGHRAAPLQ